MEGDKFCFHWTQLELGPNIPIEEKKKKNLKLMGQGSIGP